MKVYVAFDWINAEMLGIFDTQVKAENALIDRLDELIDDYPSLYSDLTREQWHNELRRGRVDGLSWTEETVQ